MTFTNIPQCASALEGVAAFLRAISGGAPYTLTAFLGGIPMTTTQTLPSLAPGKSGIITFQLLDSTGKNLGALPAGSTLAYASSDSANAILTPSADTLSCSVETAPSEVSGETVTITVTPTVPGLTVQTLTLELPLGEQYSLLAVFTPND